MIFGLFSTAPINEKGIRKQKKVRRNKRFSILKKVTLVQISILLQNQHIYMAITGHVDYRFNFS